jgi:ABC-type uncharacterized transport system substrate-binding protein
VITRRQTGWLTRVYRAALLCLLSGISVASTAESGLDVALITSDNAHQAEVAAALREHLADTCDRPCPHPVELTTVDPANAADYLSRTTPDLVVTIGSVAARLVAEQRRDIPTLFGFIPSSVWREIRDCCIADSPTRGHVLLDQPARRLLKLVREVHPAAQSVGILLGPATAARQAELDDAANAVSLEIRVENIATSEEVGRKLRLLAARMDVLLALPDPIVYNRNTVYPILLTTYSARVPVIGFSSAMVKAGAAAGLFMSTRDGGEAIALAIQAYRANGSFPADESAQPYSVETNEDVLRSLRLRTPRAAELLQNLKESKQ